MRTAPLRTGAAVLLVLYAGVIARLTLFPANTEKGTFTALDDVVSRLTDDGLDWTQIEALANVVLFVPAGFLLAVVLQRCWLSVLGCVAGSAAVEWAQYACLPSRVPSWADIEHNGLGGLLGALLAWPLVSWLRRRATARAAPQPVMPVRVPSRVR